jgi:hypothetical protein
MTDAQLIRELAERVMNWELTYRFVGGDKQTLGYTDRNGHEHEVRIGWNSPGPTAWNPLANDADAFMLVDALDPTDFTLEKSGLNWTATLASGQATGTDRRRAICLACARAVGVEVGEGEERSL